MLKYENYCCIFWGWFDYGVFLWIRNNKGIICFFFKDFLGMNWVDLSDVGKVCGEGFFFVVRVDERLLLVEFIVNGFF